MTYRFKPYTATFCYQDDPNCTHERCQFARQAAETRRLPRCIEGHLLRHDGRCETCDRITPDNLRPRQPETVH